VLEKMAVAECEIYVGRGTLVPTKILAIRIICEWCHVMERGSFILHILREN
jgi:hypothetical protein